MIYIRLKQHLANPVIVDLTNDDLTTEQNELIFKHVFEFIKKSKRFLIQSPFVRYIKSVFVYMLEYADAYNYCLYC